MSYYIHSYIKQIFSGWIKDSFSQDSVKVSAVFSSLVPRTETLVSAQIGLLNGHLALANLVSGIFAILHCEAF